jgi:adenosylhomocysteine nucleosidase
MHSGEPSSGFERTAIVDVETLLLVAAEARELAGIRRHCRGEKRLRWPVRFALSAHLAGRRWILVANGAGPTLAGEACEVAWNKQKADILVSTGFCGALDPALQAGEVFVASRVESPDGAVVLEARLPECPTPTATGRLFSMDRVVQKAEEKAALRALGGAAVEMEAVSVGLRARKWGVPFYCVRGVTDLAGEDLDLDFNAARGGDGHLSTTRILWAAARRPHRLAAELYRLNRRSNLAVRAMGDCLAECRF